MGMIEISVRGSFPTPSRGYESRAFSAMEHGHAQAVAEAIRWLVVELLPRSIKRDHELQVEGKAPSDGSFGPFHKD